jgi:hypothetical protein
LHDELLIEVTVILEYVSRTAYRHRLYGYGEDNAISKEPALICPLFNLGLWNSACIGGIIHYAILGYMEVLA